MAIIPSTGPIPRLMVSEVITLVLGGMVLKGLPPPPGRERARQCLGHNRQSGRENSHFFGLRTMDEHHFSHPIIADVSENVRDIWEHNRVCWLFTAVDDIVQIVDI